MNQLYSTWRNIFYYNLKNNVKDLLVDIPYCKSNYKGLKCTALETNEYWFFQWVENLYCSSSIRLFNLPSIPSTMPITILSPKPINTNLP